MMMTHEQFFDALGATPRAWFTDVDGRVRCMRAGRPTCPIVAVLGGVGSGLSEVEHLAMEAGLKWTTELMCAADHPSWPDLDRNDERERMLEACGLQP